MSINSSIEQTTAPPEARSARRARIWKLAGLGAAALVLSFVIRALVQNLREIDWGTVRVGGGWVALTLLFIIGARWVQVLQMQLALRALDSSISHRRLLPIVWAAWLARYMPGKIAAPAATAALLARAGVRVSLSLAAMVMVMGVTTVLSIVFAAPALLLLEQFRMDLPYHGSICLAVAAGAVLCLHPRIFLGAGNLAMRKLKRPPIAQRVALRPFSALVVWSVVRCILSGLMLWLAARAVLPIGFDRFGWMLVCAALASIGGLIAPAGVGVREAVHLLVLNSVLGPAVGLVVILHRLLHLAADLLVGAAGMAILGATRKADVPVLQNQADSPQSSGSSAR